MTSVYKDILDNFFGMILENSINDDMMEFSYKFPYDGMKEYALEICDIPFSVFLEYINEYQDNDDISADCVSQFSKLDDCLLGFCEATDNMRRPLTFEEIGERLQDDGVNRNSVANTKYGENHAKVALQFGLAQCRYNYWYISALGKVFSQLPKEKQDALMIRTLLRNKLYALIFTRLQTQDVSIESILKKVNISESTRTRRLSSVKRILTWFFGVLSTEDFRYHYKVIECPLLNRQNENLPVNYIRRSHILIPRQRNDLRNFVSLSASEKDYFTYSDLYLEQILRIPYLTKEDEKKYFKQYLAGDESAKDAIVEAYLPAIYNIARRYVTKSPNLDIQDLIGEGVYALCRAIAYFDPSSPARLITYAMYGIRGAMYELVLSSRLVSLPFNQNESKKRTLTAYEGFEQRFGRQPSAEELAELLDTPVDKVADTLKMSDESVSLEGYEDLICVENEDSPFYNLYRESLIKEINRALAVLTPREADILRKHYGIGVKEKTLEEIGIELHLTRERVRQIRDKAIRRLKSSSRSKILKTYLGEENFYDGVSLSSDSHAKQKLVEQNQTTANGQNVVEPTQTLAGSSGQELPKYASKSAVSRLNKLEQARKKREEKARLKLENEKTEIEKQIKYLTRNYLNTLPLPDQETKKYSHVNRIVAETRKVCSLMGKWIPIWLQLPNNELLRLDNNKDILTHLDHNLSVLKKSSIVPDKTLDELDRSISMLHEQISSECLELESNKKDSIETKEIATVPKEKNKIRYGINLDGYSAYVKGVSNLTEDALIIPESVNIKGRDFSVISIADSAFNRKEKLRKVITTNGLKRIESKAFFYCSSLVEIDLADSIYHIESGAFIGCSSIVNIKLPNNLITLGDGTFRNCISLQSIVIPNTITSILNNTFNTCTSLTTVELHDNIKKIDFTAFYGCKNLTALKLPSRLEYIGSRSFEYCSSLVDIVIPKHVKTIGNYAFANCNHLKRVVLPSGLTKIGAGVFEGCRWLYIIEVPEGKKEEYCKLGLEPYRGRIVEMRHDIDASEVEVKLKRFDTLLRNMTRAKLQGEIAPHKPVLMLAIIDWIVEKLQDIDNIAQIYEAIPFRPELMNKFFNRWNRHVHTNVFQPTYITPIIHMQSEPFYRLVPYPDRSYNGVQSFAALESAFQGIQLNSELMQFIIQKDTREQLRQVLIDMI